MAEPERIEPVEASTNIADLLQVDPETLARLDEKTSGGASALKEAVARALAARKEGTE